MVTKKQHNLLMAGLEDILADISLDTVPAKWQWRPSELQHFSQTKQLYFFQKDALENAAKALWLYYGQEEEPNWGKSLQKRYHNNGCEQALLPSDYDYTDNSKKQSDFTINRLGFWMATGSGKTLVIVKLIELLGNLMARKVIPRKDIMFLVHRDQLIEQFTRHVDEYNSYNPTQKIICRDLKRYESIKQGLGLVAANGACEVFVYRADLFLSKKSTTKKINVETLDNDGNWYVILDEAHRGDRYDSPLQQVYNNFARNGFLFNFSATFTDQIDKDTCAYNFNLEKFTAAGYGKKIYISQENITAFKEKESLNQREKQKVILRTLILKTYISQQLKKLKKQLAISYHSPLILTIVNSVTEKGSDLRLFFTELAKLGSGKIPQALFAEVKDSLAAELKQATYVYDNEEIPVDLSMLKKISIADVLNEVFNAKSPGRVQALIVPGNKKEIIFKLTTATDAFGLVRIGDTSKWIKDILTEGDYDVSPRYYDKSIFGGINENNNNLNILMGSRTFYEGWDSNRPNIILFINIGVQRKSQNNSQKKSQSRAQKFVLQAVGRGVRIEPERNKRRRYLSLHNSGELSEELSSGIRYENIKEKIEAIETLYVLGTDAANLEEVVKALAAHKPAYNLGELFKVNPQSKKLELLIPVYEETKELHKKLDQKFPISDNDLKKTKGLFASLNNETMLIKYGCSPDVLAHMRAEISKLKKVKDSPEIENPDFSLSRLVDYFALKNQKLGQFTKLTKNELVHFEKIKFYGSAENYTQIAERIRIKAKYADRTAYLAGVKKDFKKSDLAKKQKWEEYRESEAYYDQVDLFSDAKSFKDVKIEHLANHYYNPVLSSPEEKTDYLSSIIEVPSEIDFIEQLQENVLGEDDVFKNCDWWMFSKLNEILDKIYIPYFSPNRNNFAEFHPDFIFWMRKANNYHILFVDPKSTAYTPYEHKADGYNDIFSIKKGKNTSIYKPKSFPHGKLQVQVHLRFFGKDSSKAGKEYRHLWADNIEELINFPL